MSLLSDNFIVKLNKEDLYFLLIHQINKDFALSGIDYFFDKSDSPTEFIKNFKQKIEKLINYNSKDFTKLLYRIDLKESTIFNLIYKENNALQMIDKVSNEILNRVIKKLWYQQNYT